MRSEIATELARIDATTSSRQAADTAYADKVSIIAEVIDIQDYVAAVARAVVPDGLYTLSIDVVDEAAARVVGATIVVLSGDLDPLWRETTTGAGPVTVAVDAGTYHVRVSRPGYTIEDTDTEIAVSADTDLTLELIADTTSPAMCTIYGTLTGPAGAIVGATVEIEIRAPSENGGWNFGGSLTTTTDAAGYFAINAPQLSQVAITIDAIGWDHEIRTVPAQISRALTGWTA